MWTNKIKNAFKKKSFIANRFDEPWKWVFHVKMLNNFGISSGIAQFSMNCLKINRPSVFAGPKRGRPTPAFSIFIRSLGRSLARSVGRSVARSLCL